MTQVVTVADLKAIVADGLCIGCGFCAVALHASRSAPPVRIVYDAASDSFVPEVDPTSGDAINQEIICPGLTMDMPALSQERFGSQPADPLTGVVISHRVCHATDESLRSAAASGGIVPALLGRLFALGEIDIAYVVDPGAHMHDAHGRSLSDPVALRRCHGSVYHPVDFGRDLRKLVDSDKRFAFVGLPCQVAGLEMLKKHRPDLARRHVLSIGLFCGGINVFAGIEYYLKGFGVDSAELNEIRYRVGPWPGCIEVTNRRGEKKRIPRIQGNSRWKILRYVVAFQGYWMLPRCRMCPDQIADFADIAVGDPHLPRFKRERSAGSSIVVTRTAVGERVVVEALAAGEIQQMELSRGELLASQGYTLDNRRHVEAYTGVATRLGRRPPLLRVYSPLVGAAQFKNYVYAWVDMLKLQLRPIKSLRAFYLPLQALEYCFITFAPSLVLRRVANLLRNRHGQ